MIDSIIYSSEMQNTHIPLEDLTTYFDMQLERNWHSVFNIITREYLYVSTKVSQEEIYEPISLPEIVSTPKALYTFGTHSTFWESSRPNKNANG